MTDALWPIAATLVGLAACFVAWDSWRRQFLADTSALAVRCTSLELEAKSRRHDIETFRESFRQLYEATGTHAERLREQKAELEKAIDELRTRVRDTREGVGHQGQAVIETNAKVDRLSYEAKEEVRKLYERIGVVHKDLATFSEKTMQEFARQGGKASMNQVAQSLQVAAGDGRAPF